MPDPGPTISDIIAAAAEPGHAHRRAVLGVAPDWLVRLAMAYGLSVDGFQFTLETSAVRHIIAKHGNQRTEAARGQIAVRDDDFLQMSEVVTAPDKLIFGAKSKRGHAFIGFVKQTSAGQIFMVHEVRTGRRELAAVTMYKRPATRDAGTFNANFRLDGRTDSGAELYIIDVTAKVTDHENASRAGRYPAGALLEGSATTGEPDGRTDGGDTIHLVDQPTKVTAFDEPDKHPATIDAAGNPDLDGRTDGGATAKIPPDGKNATPAKSAWRRHARYLPPVLGVLVLAGIIFGLHGALSSVRPRDILSALAATPQAAMAQAGALLGASFCIMLVYDVPGILFARKLAPLPELTFRRIGLVSFCAYALSHVLGAPALTAAAIRVRLYAEWQVPAAGIARIIALSGTAFLLGAGTLIGVLLLLHPHDLPVVSDMSAAALRGIGGVLLAGIGFYVLIAQNRPSLGFFGRTLPLPGRMLAAGQILLACTDIGIANLILFAVLPAARGLTAAHVLAIYLAGFAAGLFSSLPAGIGVFDTFLLLGLAPYMPAASAIGAILLFRVVYYLIPASIAGLLFAGHEILLTTQNSDQ